MNTPQLQRAVFLLLLAGVTVAFFWVLMPFFGAVFWALALALLFNPLYQRLCRALKGRPNMAALLTLALVLLMVILPLAVLGASLVSDMAKFVQRARAGEFNLREYLQHMLAALPSWARPWLDRLGLDNFENVLERISSGLAQGGQAVVTHAVDIGQNTFQFLVSFVVMLYLLFFLLRDGRELSRQMVDAMPLARPHTHYLLNKFTTVVRATVKGNVVVAAVQGALGGVAFWFLDISGALFWGVVMAVLSLLPAVGAALVWGPVAVYLLTTGSVWQAVALTAWGVVVIGLSDNVLRPQLVGKDTKLPDYLVLITTLGGMALFGINGFVIGPTVAAMFVACWALFQSGGTPPQDGGDQDASSDEAAARAQHAVADARAAAGTPAPLEVLGRP